ncbi:MAG: hypothetical protein RLZZ596_2769 [Pseudomonadota bacterium]
MNLYSKAHPRLIFRVCTPQTGKVTHCAVQIVLRGMAGVLNTIPSSDYPDEQIPDADPARGWLPNRRRYFQKGTEQGSYNFPGWCNIALPTIWLNSQRGVA